MLEQDEQYLEDRGCLIIRTLCKYINSEEVFSILSTSIAVRFCRDLHDRSHQTSDLLHSLCR